MRIVRSSLLALFSLAVFGLAGPVRAGDVARGKATYGELCAKCHGASGAGDGKEAATLQTKPKSFTDCPRMAALSAEQLFKIVKDGGAAHDLSKDMPPYQEALDDDEIRDTVAYIMSLCPR